MLSSNDIWLHAHNDTAQSISIAIRFILIQDALRLINVAKIMIFRNINAATPYMPEIVNNLPIFAGFYKFLTRYLQFPILILRKFGN
jgi:hypothetical protein